MTPSKKLEEFLLEFSKKTGDRLEMVKYLDLESKKFIREYKKKRSVARNLFKKTGDILHALRFRFSFLLGLVLAGAFLIWIFYLFFDFTTYGAPLYFYFLLVVGVFMGFFPVILVTNSTFNKDREKENNFYNFVLDLENRKKNINPMDYGPLAEDIKILINKCKSGVSMKEAFVDFSKRSESEMIETIVDVVIETGKKKQEFLNTMALLTKEVFILRNKLKFEK